MRLRLLTYNIHRAIGVDRKFAPGRIAEILEHHEADIVLLQEVDQHAPRSNHLDLGRYLARELRYPHHAAGMNVELKRGRYGNVTLSRFPLGPQENIDLSLRWRKRRGAQHTTLFLERPGQPPMLDVFNVHLGLSAIERRAQVARLLALPDVCDPRHSPNCIVAGDMNDWRGLLKRQFLAAGFECATNRRPGSRWAIRTFPSYAPAGGLDKVFFRGPLRLIHAHRSRLKLARVASDHLPVVVDFELVAP
ncbi:MAG: endonuclease/exonuclease/phosphatase family protein [Phycisphaerae bacterium]